MDYRRASVNDIDSLIELRKQQLIDEGLFPAGNIDTELRSYFENRLAANEFIAWLAIENDVVVATSGLCFYQLPPTYSNSSGMVAYVTSMFTVKSFRRKGIASMMLEKILQEARSLGFLSVKLHASSDGKALYEKFGFQVSEGYMALKL
jgi:Predicted acetyltransferase involved in intracellular survival and related acetyltransferases